MDTSQRKKAKRTLTENTQKIPLKKRPPWTNPTQSSFQIHGILVHYIHTILVTCFENIHMYFSKSLDPFQKINISSITFSTKNLVRGILNAFLQIRKVMGLSCTIERTTTLSKFALVSNFFVENCIFKKTNLIYTVSVK